MAVNTAPVKWAQRADSIYLTLDLPDVKDEQLKLTKDMLSFRQVESSSFLLRCSSWLLARRVCPWGQRANKEGPRKGSHKHGQRALHNHMAHGR